MLQLNFLIFEMPYVLLFEYLYIYYKLRLFVKRKSHAGHVIKFGWERQTGAVPNFFKYGTIDGVSLNNTGILFIEQEYKF